jgi:hypothetical protein
MTRSEVLTRLAQQVVYLQGQFANTTAVVLPNFEEVRKFSKSLYDMLDELPDWLEVATQYRTYKKCEWVSSKILFVHNPTHLKGYSIDCLYRSKRAITQAGNQDLEYFNFLAAITQKQVIDFDD